MEKRNNEITEEVTAIMHRFQHGIFNLQRADEQLIRARNHTMEYIERNQGTV